MDDSAVHASNALDVPARGCWHYIAALLVGGMLACVENPEGSYLINCPGAFDIILHPATTALAVGQRVSYSAEFGEPANCGPPGPEGAENWRWAIVDPAIAAVDSLTGVVTGVSVGSTQLVVRHVMFPNLRDSTVFTIRP